MMQGEGFGMGFIWLIQYGYNNKLVKKIDLLVFYGKTAILSL